MNTSCFFNIYVGFLLKKFLMYLPTNKDTKRRTIFYLDKLNLIQIWHKVKLKGNLLKLKLTICLVFPPRNAIWPLKQVRKSGIADYCYRIGDTHTNRTLNFFHQKSWNVLNSDEYVCRPSRKCKETTKSASSVLTREISKIVQLEPVPVKKDPANRHATSS